MASELRFSLWHNHTCLSLAGILILGEYPSISPDDHACRPRRLLHLHCEHVSTCTRRHRAVSMCMVHPGSKDSLPRAPPPQSCSPWMQYFPSQVRTHFTAWHQPVPLHNQSLSVVVAPCVMGSFHLQYFISLSCIVLIAILE